MLYEVLSQNPQRPPRLVGETKEERVERMRSDVTPPSSRWYPGSYPQRVCSVRSVADVKSGKLPSLRNMAGDMLSFQVMNLDEDQRQGAATKTLKVSGDSLTPVNFDDRFGAVAVKLRERNADPEQWEIDERQRVEAAETENERRRAANDRDAEEYRVRQEDFPSELDRWSLNAEVEPPAFPERPKRRSMIYVAPSTFDIVSGELTNSLAPTATNTGTGLYSVKVTPAQNDDTQSGAPAGQVITLVTGGLTADAFTGGYVTNVTRSETRAIISHTAGTITLEGSLANWLDTDDLDIFDAWSTVQAALDQLFTDQGATLFTTIQELRLFDGTFTENVTPSTSLVVNFENFLWVRANTGDTPIIDGGASTCWTNWTTRHVRFDGITFNGTGNGLSTANIQRGAPLDVRNCTFNTGSGIFASASQFGSCVVEDCTFNLSNSFAVLFRQGSLLMRNCSISGGISQVLHDQGQRCELEGCTFRNAASGIRLTDFGSALSVKNCSFFGLTLADIDSEWTDGGTLRAISDLVALDNIHVDSALVYWLPSRTRLANVNHNTIFNATKVGRVNTTDYTTLANWQAYADDTGVSPDADSTTSDPLLTDPGAGDFSLGTSSPARHTGSGSGVLTGINSVAFDVNHPDIGAWSSGALTVVAPVITATDNGDQDSIDVAIVADNPLDSVEVFYQSLTSGGLFTWPTPQVGSGTTTVTGLLVQRYLIYAIATRGGEISEPSLIAFVTVAAADQFAAIRNALYEWVKGVAGNPTVIWREPNAPQPSRQYVSIHMDPTTVVGSDYHSNADANGIESVIGNREFIFSIQVHGQPSQDDGSASMSILERLRSSLEKRTIQDTLKAAGLAFVAEEGRGDLAGIGGTEFEARVFMDLRFRTTYQDTDDVGFIGTATDPVGTYDQ